MLKMARVMWAPVVLMGLMIVILSLLIGFANSGAVTEYFSYSKEAREAATAGSDIVQLKVLSERIFAWLPGFKFLGMGMLFAGITFALATIILTLKNAGMAMQKTMSFEIRVPKKPMVAKLFPMLMMLGLMTLVVAFVIGLWLSGVVGDYWNHSIAGELNPAGEGSVLLEQLAMVTSVKAWLVPLKFVGVALLLAGISFALFTIRFTLQFQAVRLQEMLSTSRG